MRHSAKSLSNKGSDPLREASGDAVADDAAIQLDFVGSLENAATVISRLHRGEKRLVFVDSRTRAERLSAELRQLQGATFATHSSLSQEQRHQAEEAFASRDDCVIVATSYGTSSFGLTQKARSCSRPPRGREPT